MLSQIFSPFFKWAFFEGEQPPAGGGGNTPPADPAKPAAGSGAPAQPDSATVIADLKAQNAALESRIVSLESKPVAEPATPIVPVAGEKDEIEEEITLRKNQLAAIRKGEIDAAYEPDVQAALSAATARKEGRIIVERENARSGFVSEYNQNLAQAYKDFPELADQNSELAKETLKLLSTDRSYARVQTSLKAQGKAGEKVDFRSLDPAVTFKAAHTAHSILIKRNGGKPLSQQQPNPKLPNTALESGSGAPPVPGDDDLARLEKEAVDTGDPNKWKQLIKARDQRQKAKALAQ